MNSCINVLDNQIDEILNTKYHYNLASIFSDICDLSILKQYSIYDEIINNYLEKIKLECKSDVIYKCEDEIVKVLDFYDYDYYFGDENRMDYLENEADEIVFDLVLKLFEENGRNLKMPIKIENLIQFSMNSKISENEISKVIWWIILRLSVIYKVGLKNRVS